MKKIFIVFMIVVAIVTAKDSGEGSQDCPCDASCGTGDIPPGQGRGCHGAPYAYGVLSCLSGGCGYH